jgi:putative phosphoesterase
MLLGVVSDTHGHVEYAQQAVRMLESLEVEAVLHCGDIGSTTIPPLFSQWPAHYVFGNVDYDGNSLGHAIEAAGGVCYGRFGELELAGRKIAFLHSDDGALFRQTIACGKYDLVCYGHTHQAESHQAGPTWVLNPGALFRASPHSLAIVDLPAMEITNVRVT